MIDQNTGFGQSDGLLLFQQPTLSQTSIVFAYAGDLWTVGRDGGDARRLTSHPGRETDPHFSPDGTLIAFTGEYDGNVDVYTIPATGGAPRRLTYHPSYDQAVGWTPDGQQVLFASTRNSVPGYGPYNRLFTMPMDGTFPAELPLPSAEEGSLSPDGSRLAYVPVGRNFFTREFGVLQAWKRYRGGKTTPIWIAHLADSSVEKIPRDNSNDFNPMWVGDDIYFLSDRDGAVTLFVYNTVTKEVKPVLENHGLDIKSASAGPGAIVYEQFGSLHLFDIGSGKACKLDIRVRGDFPEVRPQFKKVAGLIRAARLSPTGASAVFEARGEVITVSVQDGEIRNLTNTPGVAEREPAWSPNGKWIAYFSDESGRYALHIRDPHGDGGIQKVPIEYPPIFFQEESARNPVWSPDSRKIAFVDIRLNLWCVDLEQANRGHTATAIRVDVSTSAERLSFTPAWSPDSRWLAYTRQLHDHLRAVFVHELGSGRTHQLTDGMSDAQFVAFDRGGDYLYFTASTDVGPALESSKTSGWNRRVTRRVYAVLLRKDLRSPLSSVSKEEESRVPQETEPSPGRNAADGASGPITSIDLEEIGERMVSLPISPRNYTGLEAGKAGVLFLLESDPFSAPDDGGLTLHRFELATQRTEKLMEGISRFALSHNGAKMLVRQGDRWAVVPTDGAPKPDAGALKLDAMEVRVDPLVEWRQMYREAFRNQRDCFYDPGHHGIDLNALERKYEPYLENLTTRADLDYLFSEIFGELTVGHLDLFGGERPEVRCVPVGLLGADYRIENGRYRFARIYRGDPWNPDARSPLSEPGARVLEGEYLLAVNGRELQATDNVYRFFEGLAGKKVRLRLGPEPNEVGSRIVTVVPVEDERSLRHFAWIEENRSRVAKMSGGRVAYVYVQDTGTGGYTSFNRYYFAQTDKEGLVIDERFNTGGLSPDHIIYYLRRPLLHYWTQPAGEDLSTPAAAIFGPKAMIINEYAGSGGDNLPWLFRRAGLGVLVGKRTWGGEVGASSTFFPRLMDGGCVPAPNFAFYTPEGKWEIENHGVEPDIEVELDPQSWRAGRDPQLEKAVEVVMKALQKNPLPKPRRPDYPNYRTE